MHVPRECEKISGAAYCLIWGVASAARLGTWELIKLAIAQNEWAHGENYGVPATPCTPFNCGHQGQTSRRSPREGGTFLFLTRSRRCMQIMEMSQPSRCRVCVWRSGKLSFDRGIFYIFQFVKENCWPGRSIISLVILRKACKHLAYLDT